MGIKFIWECPRCGYIISKTEYRLMKFNLPCPRCGEKEIVDFIYKEYKKEE